MFVNAGQNPMLLVSSRKNFIYNFLISLIVLFLLFLASSVLKAAHVSCTWGCHGRAKACSVGRKKEDIAHLQAFNIPRRVRKHETVLDRVETDIWVDR